MTPRRHLAALAALAAAVACVYASACTGDFVLDARVLVLENPVIRAVTRENLRRILTSDYWQPMATDGLYRPVTILSYLFDYAVLGHGTSPVGYHVLNVLLHVACVAAVYGLVWRLCRRAWPALVGAALFAVHPLATEAVTNVVGRADLLATLGVLGAILCHQGAVASGGRRRALWSAGLFLAAGLAYFSKESGLVLVPVLAAYDLVGRAGRLRLRDYGVPLALLVVYAAVRWTVFRTGSLPEEISPVDNPLVEASTVGRLLTAAAVLGRQLGLVVWPGTLSADYSYRQIPLATWPPATAADWLAPATIGALALGAGATVAVRRTRPALAFLLVFAALALLPTANVLTLTGSIMAERFLYLPLVGLAGSVALLVEPRRRRPAVDAVVAAVLAAYAWRAHGRNADWQSELRLWERTVAAAPDSAKAHKGYAAALFAADPDHAAIARVIAEAERAVAIRPDYVNALVDLGSYYVVRGDLAGEGATAAAWYAKGVAVLERARLLDGDAVRRFAERMRVRGRPPEAPRADVQLLNDLSLAYARAGRFEEALAAYRELRRAEPANPRHYVDISAVLCNLGRWEEAAIALFQAAAIDPGDADATRRLTEVYRVFYPDANAVAGDTPGRVEINLDDPVVHHHRCRAYVGLEGLYAQGGMTDAARRVRALADRFCDAGEGDAG